MEGTIAAFWFVVVTGIMEKVDPCLLLLSFDGKFDRKTKFRSGYPFAVYRGFGLTYMYFSRFEIFLLRKLVVASWVVGMPMES